MSNKLLDAATRGRIDMDELDGHALAGIDAADHAGDHEGLGGTEGEAKLDRLTALEGARIEHIEAAGGEVTNARDRSEVLDGDFVAGHAGIEPPILVVRGHCAKCNREQQEVPPGVREYRERGVPKG